MTTLRLILAVSLGLCGPVIAGPDDKEAEKTNPDESLSDLKKSLGDGKELSDEDREKLTKEEQADQVGAGISEDPAGGSNGRTTDEAASSAEDRGGGRRRARSGRGTTAPPSESVRRKERETTRGMSLSGAKAMTSALRAAEHFKRVMPALGDAPGGPAGAPDPRHDPIPAGAGARIGPAVPGTREGSPAPAAPLNDFRDRPSSEPEALSRYPSFFSVISRERFADLKMAYGAPGTQQAFRDIARSPAARDFLWSRSCSRVAGDCNPYAAATYYRKGDYVPPTDLDEIWKSLSKEAGEDSPSDSEYSEEEEREAASALAADAAAGGGPRFPRRDLSSLLARAQASVSGWLGGGPQADEASGSFVRASADHGSTGAPGSGARFAHKSRRIPAAPGMEEGPTGSDRPGPPTLLPKLLFALGALLVLAGIARLRR